MTGTGGGSTGPTTLIFSANDGTNGVEPWVSDGTVIGTQMLEDINGSGGDSNPEGFTRVGDRIIFTAIGPDGRELWAVESDLGGAQQIRDINPSGDGVDAGQSFPVLDGHAYFRGNDPSNGGQELWRTDGNQAERIANIRSPGDSTPHNFAVFNGHVFFAADDGTNGIQLWKTDGTNTQMVGPFNPGGDFAPRDLTVAADDLFFTAEGEPGERELWSLESADSTPQPLEVNPDASAGADIRHIAPFDQGVVFAADDTNAGFELWVSEGTDVTTQIIEDINIGAGDGVPPNSIPFVANGRLVFAADPGGSTFTPWTSAPSAVANPEAIAYSGSERPRLSGEPGTFGALNGEVLFPGISPSLGSELWRVNETGTEIFLVDDINDSMPGVGSSPASFATFDGNLYFSANDGTGRELWRYDGSSASKVLSGGPTNVSNITAIE